ncbi:dTDP-4-dehydrorhamnose 3,5-epimerase family protein [Brachyspira pilosicoli]|uniref:dTDP-4-dehydrorhamnose 3,5-epimerase family protein n=1 Tax=Brachyspira pilosicoli TaxID=52584 RepID=UPI00300662AA
MFIEKTNIDEAYIIQNNYIEDERGYFLRLFCNDELKKLGIDFEVKQSSLSYNKQKYTIRGMHYQKFPYAEIKVVRCLKGKIFDVIADIRKDSPTFGQYYSVELSENNCKMLYIPPYVAHGFQTLEDNTMVCYFMGASFVAEASSGFNWLDPFFNIRWPNLENVIISDKDKNMSLFNKK